MRLDLGGECEVEGDIGRSFDLDDDGEVEEISMDMNSRAVVFDGDGGAFSAA